MIKNPKIREILQKKLPDLRANIRYDAGLHLKFSQNLTQNEKIFLQNHARSLMPWRKGPFFIDELFIDSEWRSFLKWDALKNHVNLRDKIVCDIGANNGFYMLSALTDPKNRPQEIFCIEPSELFFAQFLFINHFARQNIKFLRQGIEDMNFQNFFDVIFCLGVLYHRQNPHNAVKCVARALKNDGEAIFDTLLFAHEMSLALCPVTYACMKNVFFVPSIAAFTNICKKAGLNVVQILKIAPTTEFEQRKTEWIDGQSLPDFLIKNKNFVKNPEVLQKVTHGAEIYEEILRTGDLTLAYPQILKNPEFLTAEGFHPPIRGYFRVKKEKNA